MRKKPKSRAKDLEQAFWNELERTSLTQHFERAYVLHVDPPTWIYHKPKGGRWCWDVSLKKRAWEFDFAAPEYRVLVEIDGSTFLRGGHTTGTRLENQYNKQAQAAIAGWRVLRFTRHMIESGVAVVLVTKALFH